MQENPLIQPPSLSHFVDSILDQAIGAGASDIHFEPFETRFRIRYRVDGVFKVVSGDHSNLCESVVSRIKVLSLLNISENRIPQDGRFEYIFNQRKIDIRVSILPTRFGETVVLRILDHSGCKLNLSGLGMPEQLLNSLLHCIHQSHGLFLTTGPTGSGKTTTLFSVLNELNNGKVKILTVEDPVEFDIDGIQQIQVNSEVGLDFPILLRSFLRHDPDKILIGEIRDEETAQIAIQSSLTGHMVFSSLHTNHSIGAISRLIDMGVEPYLISGCLVAVLAQRLVRVVNPDVIERYQPTEEQATAMGVPIQTIKYEWCRIHPEKSNRRDLYDGRAGIFEFLSMDDDIRRLVSRNHSEMDILKCAKRKGFCSLRQDAIRLLDSGVTTYEEVFRHI